MAWSADMWRRFAQRAREGGSPLYGALAMGVMEDADLLALATSGKPNQPPANILFAAVHYLLIRGAAHRLRAFYADLGGTDDGDPMPAFKDFVVAHRAELAALIATRTVNTNEVGRCAYLAPGFRAVAMVAAAPLHLIEIGPSAGLNLNWDRYGVRYERGGVLAAEINPGARPALRCALRGEGVLPLGPAPVVAARVGLELNPVDIADAGARDWLRALVWPGRAERFSQLEDALAVAATHPPNIRGGDALDLLPEALAEAAAAHAPVVFHTKAIYQFTDEMRDALDYILIAASLRRPVYHLGQESAPDGTDRLELICYRDGQTTRRILAVCNSHGVWIEWLGDALCDNGKG